MSQFTPGSYGSVTVGSGNGIGGADASRMPAKTRAQAALKAHDLEAAARWFELATQEDPKDVEALSGLGQSLCQLGRRNEGTARLREAGHRLQEVAPQPAQIETQLGIVARLQQWGDFAGALELCKQLELKHPGDHRIHQLLALTYSQLNRTTDAIAAGQRALKLDPENSMMHILQASLEADGSMLAAAKARLEDVLSYELNDREEFRAHKELARVLDKLGEYDQVFPHLHAAAGFAAGLPEYRAQNASLVPDLLQASHRGFDRHLLSHWSTTSFPSQPRPPVFLIGFLRSGTTLTQEVLDAHPDIFVADEADFVWAMQNELHRMDRSAASTAEKLAKLDLAGIMQLREFYWNRVHQRFGDEIGSRLLVDKFTMNTLDLGLINCIFPDAKVLFVMRDPRDVCVSCYMQLMAPSPTTTHLLSWQGTAKIYAKVMAWWMYIRHQLTMKYLELRYEDAVAQFEPTFRKVFEFLELPWDAGVTEFHKRAANKFISTPSRTQVAQPLYSSSVTRWRHYATEFPPVAQALTPYVEAFGYDPF